MTVKPFVRSCMRQRPLGASSGSKWAPAQAQFAPEELSSLTVTAARIDGSGLVPEPTPPSRITPTRRRGIINRRQKDLAPYNGGAFGVSGGTAGTVTLTPDNLGYVIDGCTYVNYHTAANGSGEIRGQVVR